MKIVEIAPVVAENPYAEDITALAAQTEANPLAAGQWEVDPADVGKAKYKIGKAANAIDKTAKFVSESEPDKKSGLVTLTYRITRRMRAGTRKGGTVGTADQIDAPTAETVEATAE